MFVFGDGWLARAKRASALYQPSGVNLLPSTSKITNCCTSSFAVWAEALAHAAGPALAANPMTNKNNDFILVFVKCPRLLYQSQCKFSVDDSAGMRSGAGTAFESPAPAALY